jgi:YVTN family beta-propeller protein
MSGVDRRRFLLAASGLLLAPRMRLASTAPHVALVTADLESRLVAVEIPSGRVLSHLPTLAYPRSVQRVGTAAVVAHSDIGAVTVVDGRTLEIVHVMHGFVEPRYTIGHPDGRHAYVTDAGRGDVAVIEVETGHVLAREAVGPHARHITLDATGRTLWIALGSKAEEIAVVDVSDRVRPRLVRRFGPPFLAHDVGFAPDGRHVWVSAGDTFQLGVYDAATGRLLRRTYGDFAPQHVTFARGLAFVTSGWSGTLRVYRADGRSLSRTTVPVGSYNVQADFGWIVTAALGHGDLTIVDERGHVVRSVRVARSSHDACILAAA